MSLDRYYGMIFFPLPPPKNFVLIKETIIFPYLLFYHHNMPTFFKKQMRVVTDHILQSLESLFSKHGFY